MSTVSDILLDLLREAWAALAGGMIAIILLAVLAQVLRTASASVIGARFWVWDASLAIVGLVVLALFTFLGVPTLLHAAQDSIPSGGGCGPIADLGSLAAGLIAALAALRILKALVLSAAVAAVGGGSSLSRALLEAGEAVLGMVFASAALPIAAQFLGVC